MLAPQSEANVSRHKCNLNKKTTEGVHARCVVVRKNYRYVQEEEEEEETLLIYTAQGSPFRRKKAVCYQWEP